jgi:solute carrier family 25 iron transporter 28/37
MIQNEGLISLYRSFPVTLATNIPYGMVMVGTNEFCKQQWTKENNGQLTLGVTLGASSLAGFVAAATTTPLDRIKTYLQTQQLSPACLLTPANTSPESCPLQNSTVTKPIVADWKQAALRIYNTEGMVGFFRGMTPRILSHTPAVAISWTTYETAKRYLQKTFADE